MHDCYPLIQTVCEPMMSKYDLYPKTTHGKRRPKSTRLMMDILSWSDGANSLVDIAERTGMPVWELYDAVNLLLEKRLIEKINQVSSKCVN